MKQIPWLEKIADEKINQLSSMVEVKIFPSDYSFDKELSDNSIGILIRGSLELIEGSKASAVADVGFVVSKLNQKISNNSKISSGYPVTMVWVASKNVVEFQNLIPHFSSQIS